MERIRRGEIWTVTLPAFPKPRPALVVSIDAINDLLPDVLVMPITSKPGPLRVPIGESVATGLRGLSFAKCESTGPVHKSRLKKRIGRFPQESWPALEAGLRRVFGMSDEPRENVAPPLAEP